MRSILRDTFFRFALPSGLAILLLLTADALAGAALSRDADVLTVQLGDVLVQIVTTERAPVGLTFVSVHENEQSAVTAAQRAIVRHGGRLVELRAQRKRLVSFKLREIPHTFDPNRMFTDGGVERSLRRYGPYSRLAHDAVTQLGKRLVAHIRNNFTPPLVAVHNNTDGALSVESYRKGSRLQGEAARVAINPKLDPDDFFLVTDRAIFDRLATAGFNVVLQSAQPTDDGSMSVFCRYSGIPYLNVEAEFEHLSEQSRMLDAVVELVRGRRP